MSKAEQPPLQAGDNVQKFPVVSGRRRSTEETAMSKVEQSPPQAGDNVQKFLAEKLRAYVERVRRLQEEKKAIGDDIADIYKEAKGNGYDAKALREVVRKLGQDRDQRLEHEALVRLYMDAAE